MALAQTTLIQRVRRILGDNPYRQNGSVATDSGTSITVDDSSKFDVGAVLEFQDNGEQVVVKTITNATTVEVYSRGHSGTTAAAHSSGQILIDPSFFYIEIIDGLERTIQTLWPHVWKKVTDSVTPSTTTIWFDLASDAIDLIQVVQRYGTSDEYLAFYGAKGSGLPVSLERNLPTALVASGVALKFKNGFADDTNAVQVDYRAKITTGTSGGNYSDLDDGLIAETIVYGAAAKLVGNKEIPLISAFDVSQGETPLGPQQRLQASVWLERQYRSFLSQANDELTRTIPPMKTWSR